MVWWRINEATALMRVFISDKNPELKNPRPFPCRIKRMLKSNKENVDEVQSET
jgi:hypothetical protein